MIKEEEKEKLDEVKQPPKKPNKAVVITDFETGDPNVVKANKIHGCSVTKPCLKFVVAAIISIGTTTLGALLLFNSSTTLVTLGAGLISSNLTYWTDSPNYSEVSRKRVKVSHEETTESADDNLV